MDAVKNSWSQPNHSQYHNAEHCFYTAISAYNIGVLGKASNSTLLELFLAGLYHDTAHPYEKDDFINVNHSIDYYRKVGIPLNKDLEITHGSVCDLIAQTVNPIRDEISVPGQYLRDADITQILAVDSNQREHWINALNNELKTNFSHKEIYEFPFNNIVSAAGHQYLDWLIKGKQHAVALS